MKKSWAPPAYSIREPTDTAQERGRIVNPPRAMKIGGVGKRRFFRTETTEDGLVGGKGPVSDRGRGRK